MKNEELKSIPPEDLVRLTLEEAKLALLQKRPLTKEVLEFDLFLRRMLSGFLLILDGRLTDQEFEKVSEDIYSKIAYEANAVNVLGQALLRIFQLLKEQPSLFPDPMNFAERVKDAYQYKKSVKSEVRDFEATFAEISREPIIGISRLLNYLIWEQRLLRRFLRSRFGMKQRLLHRPVFKQTRLAKSQREFINWRHRNRRTAVGYTEQEILADLQNWDHERLRENELFCYAQERLISIQTLQMTWQIYIFLSFTSLHQKHGGGGSVPKSIP